MQIRRALTAAFAIACLGAVLACGTDPHAKGNTLDIDASPLPTPFQVGDTSSFWTLTKTVILPTGQPQTTHDYFSYALVSSDTTVVGIYEDKRLVARKAGSAEVKAVDTKSDLVSETSVKVTVTAP